MAWDGGTRYGKLLISTSSAFIAQPAFVLGYRERLIGDSIGDGRSDVIRVDGPDSNAFRVTVFLSIGSTLTALPEQSFSGYSGGDPDVARLADIDGDGRSDLLLAFDEDPYANTTTYAYRVLRWTGQSFTQLSK